MRNYCDRCVYKVYTSDDLEGNFSLPTENNCLTNDFKRFIIKLFKIKLFKNKLFNL